MKKMFLSCRRYELVFPKAGDEYFGGKDAKTGKWNGMVGMVERKEVDMIASDLTVSAQRREIMDFSLPFYEDSITVLLPRSQFDKDPFTFLYPFSLTVSAECISLLLFLFRFKFS